MLTKHVRIITVGLVGTLVWDKYWYLVPGLSLYNTRGGIDTVYGWEGELISGGFGGTLVWDNQ